MIAFLCVSHPAAACDLCAIYTGSLMQQDKTGLWLAIGEQYTNFNTIRVDGDKVANPDNEWIHSSITQLLVGHTITRRFGVQMNIPLISREYRRVEDGVPTRGDVGGLGDISILVRAIPYSGLVGSALVHTELLAGIKTPTGDGDRLAEELPEEDAAEDHLRTRVPRHAGHEEHDEEESAVHGHDLALGSGSADGLFAASGHASWKRLFLDGAAQYAVRGNGDFHYEFADDLTWESGLGVYALAEDRYTASIAFVTSGETKGKDHQLGIKADDTSITAVYVGPAVTFTWSTHLHADFACDLPVLQNETEKQIVADYRLRAGLVWRF